MFSSTFLTITSLALIPAALAQLPSVPSGLSVPTEALSSVPTAEALSVVQNLLPSAGITSLSPAQATELAAQAASYVDAYTASNPIAELEQQVAVGALLGGGAPPPEAISSIQQFLQGAETAILANPTGYIASLDALVSPYAFAGQVSTYAGNLVDGLRTVVASELSVSAPPPAGATPSTANAAAPAAMPTGVVGVAAAAAMGVVGIAML